MLVESVSDVTTMDHWLKSAIADNTLVADLLLRLKYSSKPLSVSMFSHWGSKQPRSSASRCDAKNRKKDESASTRFSPTTPLSWTSLFAEACEDSTRLTRSKATASGEGNSASTENCKRKKEIEDKKASFEAQRASNESLKRRKLDFGSLSGDKPNSSADEHLSTLPRIVPLTSRAHEDDTHPQAVRTEIPDLNMMPSEEEEEEEDSYAHFPYGMS